MTRSPVPVVATATKIPSPYVTPYQSLFASQVLMVQVVPSGLVMTRLLPDAATATKIPLPYVTAYQSLSAAEVRMVQMVPSGLVMIRWASEERLTLAIPFRLDLWL